VWAWANAGATSVIAAATAASTAVFMLETISEFASFEYIAGTEVKIFARR
jgi:hypothetical protein